MTVVNFFNKEFIPPGHLTYSVIVARHQGKWVFVRHNERTTWEIPGGHIEEGESSFEAAGRELTEETGAINAALECVATYSVEKNSSTGYGRLFFAEIESMGPIPDTSEIGEAILMEKMPDSLTWPDIQPHLFARVVKYLEDGTKG